jgi:hypothetical protein
MFTVQLFITERESGEHSPALWNNYSSTSHRHRRDPDATR